MNFSIVELMVISDALESRISDIESWVEEGETYFPLEVNANKARRNDLTNRRILHQKVEDLLKSNRGAKG